MNQRERFMQLLIRWGLVVLPTVLAAYITLRFVNFSYTSLNTGIGTQSVYFGLGVLLAYSLYYYRARWVITLAMLLVGYWLLERMISRLPGEFDVFYTMARFQLYGTLFISGWVTGFLLARVRWSYVIIFGLFATVTLVTISNTIDVSISYVLLHVAPVIVYGLYMLFITPLLKAPIEWDRWKTGKFVIRFGLFVLLVLFALLLAGRIFSSDLKAVERELGARGAKGKDGNKSDSDYDDRNGLMEKGSNDDGYRLKDTMRVNSRMSQSDKLMFCSRLDNYFPDGSPAPLYFVYHYLTRFDSITQSFTRDINVPSFDEFEVDPSNLPLYYSYTDTSIVRKSMAKKFRKLVAAQVYLSENTWKHAVLAPANVFSIQTIPVEKDFQKMFLSGYKVISYASDLNNAYFVYNITADPRLGPMQEKRYDELRTIKGYRGIDQKFMAYYTKHPTGGIYDSIAKLANSLIPADSRPVDKVIAVRDFFLRRNENGDRLFRYSLKAGAVDDPNIPSLKMLYNFLFKTRTGYCTYYAGASLFMLRSLGVPARFTTGFAAINRSDKNKGWYWFYASQAHAWTQVYFPEYGWMDFDMTIGNEDQQGAPKPDGTPPLPPPDPWLVLNSKAETVDVPGKKIDASFNEMIFLDVPFKLNKSLTKKIDATKCRVVYNDRDTTFAAVHPGDSLLIIAYKDSFRKIPQPQPGVSIENQVAAFPSPIIVDEIHIRGPKEQKKDGLGGKAKAAKEPEFDWRGLGRKALIGLAGLFAFILLLPALYLLYRLVRIATAGSTTSRADQIYRTALYRFHMAGLERENETPLAYARTRIDPSLNAGFEPFMLVYLRWKYSQAQPLPDDAAIINQFAKKVGRSIRQNVGITQRIIHYLNPLLALRYFSQPETTEHETSLL